MLNIGLVGFGYWGENLARNLSRLEEAKFVGLSEVSGTRCALFQKLYPNVRIQHYDELLKNSEAVVIATPPHTHYQLALTALTHGCHVFIEKPMCLSSADCRKLIIEAEKRKLIIAVDHTFVHTSAVKKINEIINQEDFGKLFYYDSTRINLGKFQSDCDVVWDLAVHDLAILEHLLAPVGEVSVSCKTFAHYSDQQPDQAFINIQYQELNAHLNVSWLSPVKLRNVLLAGEKKMIVYDDIEPDEKVKIYDKGIEADKNRVSYRNGDVFIPRLDTTREGLTSSLRDFLDSISTGRTPLTDGYSGLRVVYLLEIISQSARNAGETLKIVL